MASKNEMVQYGAIYRLRCGCQPLRGLAIRIAWPRIAARVIVRQNDARASVQSGIGNDLTQRKLAACFISLMPRHVKTARFIIDMGYEQAFACRVAILKTTREKGLGGCEAVKS